MELKKSLTEDDLDDIAIAIDNEGLGYMMLYGGLVNIEPELVLENREDIKKVGEALKVIRNFANSLPVL